MRTLWKISSALPCARPSTEGVSLVNLEIDDPVNDESRVMEIIDPRQVEVAGLVDAIDLPFVRAQALARLRIDSLPGRELFGVVTTVGENPRTERGWVSYSIDIAVELDK